MIATRLNGLFLAALSLTLTACATTEPAFDGPVILPHYRYAVYSDRDPVIHFTGNSDADYAGQYHMLPPAVGPMRLDCQGLEEVGIRFDEPGPRSRSYGTMTKYRFEWTHSEYPGIRERGMRYWRNNPWTRERNSYFLDSLLRINLKPDDWLENGTLRLQVRVEGRDVFETEFQLVNCLVNMYRTPTPPSELLEER